MDAGAESTLANHRPPPGDPAAQVPSASTRATAPGVARAPRALMVRLYLLALLTTLVVQAGGLQSSDALVRYRTARTWWTDEPVSPPGQEVPTLVVGIDGAEYPPFGVGQSVLMLPADIIGSTVLRAVSPSLAASEPHRTTLVAVLCFPLLAAATMAFAYRLLVALGCSARESVGGALVLLLCTSLLPYLQVHQENSLVIALTLLALERGVTWLHTESRRALAAAAAALGALLLTRVPAFVAVGSAALVLVAMTLAHVRRSLAASAGVEVATARVWRALREVAVVGAPVILAAVVIDRAIQVSRYGWAELTTTYWDVFARQQQQVHPTRAPGWPFVGDPLEGATGPLLDPERSILLTDPLIVLTLVVATTQWRRLAPAARAAIAAVAAGLLVTVALHARLEFWNAAPAWGARYHQPFAVLLAFFAVPLALRHGSRSLRGALPVIAALAFAWQLAATSVDHKVEEVQRACGERTGTLVEHRLANVARVAGGHPLLTRPCATPLAPELSRLTFMPFRAGPELPRGTRMLLGALWLATLTAWAATAFSVARMWRMLPRGGAGVERSSARYGS